MLDNADFQNLAAFLHAAAHHVPLFYTSLFALSLAYSTNTSVPLLALSDGVNVCGILMGPSGRQSWPSKYNGRHSFPQRSYNSSFVA